MSNSMVRRQSLLFAGSTSKFSWFSGNVEDRKLLKMFHSGWHSSLDQRGTSLYASASVPGRRVRPPTWTAPPTFKFGGIESTLHWHCRQLFTGSRILFSHWHQYHVPTTSTMPPGSARRRPPSPTNLNVLLSASVPVLIHWQLNTTLNTPYW